MRARIAIALAAVLASAACGNKVEDVTAEPTTAASTPSATESLPASTATTAAYDDTALLEALVTLATAPSAEAASALPFAAQVRLGLGPDLVATRPRDRLASFGGWDVDLEAFRGHVGPFNALGRLAAHADGDDSLTRFTTTIGEHPHCASPPAPAPAGLADHRHISLQPTDDSIDGCLEWFTVDLFLDDSGTIDTVTFDIWEP
ncbi:MULTISPECIES: hypothetical protein [unclassified Nocardioides]|uniref:hypothetical protein n=1 Tax=unclassified Nocardioides TaxID=2615069 RepID=UPI0006F35A5C|nr:MULTISPECIES: hypothetical protein [unclassified Nocardioides]KRA38206.1 hypothetical protein ASD81_06035 [Nocardioides sp. Root614]KRA92166.1 hypothetical protein ASD84_06300 [Nocardioides sp. Root682]